MRKSSTLGSLLFSETNFPNMCHRARTPRSYSRPSIVSYSCHYKLKSRRLPAPGVCCCLMLIIAALVQIFLGYTDRNLSVRIRIVNRDLTCLDSLISEPGEYALFTLEVMYQSSSKHIPRLLLPCKCVVTYTRNRVTAPVIMLR